MIRVGDLARFQKLEDGTVAPFPEDTPRHVRLTINAPYRSVVSIVPMAADGSFADDAEPQFLALVEGLEDVEFYTEGSFALHADATIWLHAKDGDQVAIVIPDAETFTRITERRAVDPEMQRLQEMLLMNQERRMGIVYEELRREREGLETQRRKLDSERAALDQREGASGGDKPPAKPADGAGKPARKPEKAPAGDESGEDDA